jgi:hypothetical protein
MSAVYLEGRFGREVLIKNRDVVSMLMGLTVAWNMGFATGCFGRARRAAAIPVIAISYALNAALIIFAPWLRMAKGRPPWFRPCWGC